MTDGLKTIRILNIVAFCTLGMMGCSDGPVWDAHVHEHGPHYHEYREDAYGHAYLGPEMSRWATIDAEMAATPMADHGANTPPAQ